MRISGTSFHRAIFTVFAGICLCFYCSLVFAQEEVSPFDAQVRAINEVIQQKNLSQAQTSVDQFWAEHSGEEGFVDAVRRVKDAYWTNEFYPAHFDLCERIVTAFPNDPLSIGIQADRVTGYIARKDLSRAAEELDRFWDLYSRDERFVDFARRIKDHYWWGKHYAEHFQFCDELVSLLPNDPLTVGILADEVNGYVILKDSEKAAQKLDELWVRYSTHPDFVEKLKNIKEFCWLNENYPLHFSICERIAQEFPDHPLTIGLLADEVGGYINLNDPNSAAETLDRFWTRYHTHPDFLEQFQKIKNVCWWSKNYAMYFPLCQRFVEQFPNDPAAVGLLADQVNGYVMLKESDKAAETFERFWNQYSTHPDFLEQIKNTKNICWWNKNYALHFAICQRVAQAFPDDPRTIQVRADEVTGYLDRGDMDKAETLVQQFLSEPHTGDEVVTFLNPVANLYNLKGDYPKADALYQHVLDSADADDGRLVIAKMGQLASRIATTDPNIIQQQFDRLLTDYADDPNLVKGVLPVAEVYYLKGQTDFSRGNTAAANESFDQAIALLDSILPVVSDAHDQSLACYMKGLSYWYRGDLFKSSEALLDSLDLFPNHPHAGSTCRMIADCYVKLKAEGVVDPNEADPVIEWGYKTLFDQYPDSRDVEYAAIRLIEINLARGKPVTAAVYINWLLDHTASGDPRRMNVIHKLMAGLEVCGQ
ncbi:MAG TPA: hypothetical protein PK052_11310 [Anaerohalosphaeraceae bacterium]|nr:hypothetical protein [Anaerohalosphaeraceae bacterium]HOM77193.1 hypothetical protein [Anaerohalosphaeraceae bacterium]HPC65270.1 hypothetical protein [Anaerohalosphaeraceae bacterium]HRS72627.1 hypothetical protein [Anaerohalosphaeraceae bacterium]